MSEAPGGALGQALERLAAVDERLGQPWRSLSPEGGRARALAGIGRAVLVAVAHQEPAPGAYEAFADGLGAIALAQRDAFPDNLLGDLDALAACLWRDAAAAPEGAASFLQRQCACVVALQHLFGRTTVIRFRYAHDFLYGFDWAKWVTRAPAERGSIGPFDPAFLQSMRVRGDELLTLLARGGDVRYRPLQRDQPRNPFSFSREPADELALHRALAADHAIPVAAWSIDGNERWTRPFSQLRRERAQALGLVPADAIPRGA